MKNLAVLTTFPYTGPWNRESNDIQAWATAFDADHVNVYRLFDFYHRLKKYDLLMLELIEPRFHLPHEIKKRFPQKKLIGMIEGSLANFDQKYSPAEKVKAIEIFREVDALGVLIKDSVPFFQQFTDKPVFYLGVPYPLLRAKKHEIDPGKKDKLIEINICNFNKNGGASRIFTFNDIQKAYPQVRPLLFSSDPKRDQACAKKAGLDVAFKKMQEWQEYFIEHAQAYLGLNLDYRYTWGRFPIDCAAVGIPCVGSAYSQTQAILFPELIVSPFDVKRAKELTLMLLNSKDFYNKCREHAFSQLDQFDLLPSKKRLLEFIKKEQW